MREFVEEVLYDEMLAKDLQETHAYWPLAVGRMTIRGKEENIIVSVIEAHLLGERYHTQQVKMRWIQFLKGTTPQ
jgi:hypothetical protein